MDSDGLARRIVAVAELSGTFLLRSGRAADTYFDKYRFEADPRLLAAVAAGLAPLVPAGTEVLAGLELGGVPVAVALAREVDLPCAFVRKVAKSYGTRDRGRVPAAQLGAVRRPGRSGRGVPDPAAGRPGSGRHRPRPGAGHLDAAFAGTGSARAGPVGRHAAGRWPAGRGPGRHAGAAGTAGFSIHSVDRCRSHRDWLTLGATRAS